MNIQIFGKQKCFDTRKAERYFKERKIKYQLIDLPRYGMSKGEFQSVKAAVGGVKAMIDEKSKDYESSYIAYVSTEQNITDKLMENRCSKRRSCAMANRPPSAFARRFGKPGNSGILPFSQIYAA